MNSLQKGNVFESRKCVWLHGVDQLEIKNLGEFEVVVAVNDRIESLVIEGNFKQGSDE